MRATAAYLRLKYARFRSSALVLIAANLIPLLGVLFWNWSAFEVIALYWAENVVTGVFYVLKMVTCSPRPAPINWDWPVTADELDVIRKDFGLTNAKINDVDELIHIKAAIEAAGKADQMVTLPSGIHQPESVLSAGLFYLFMCVVHGLAVANIFGPGSGYDLGTLAMLADTIYNDCFWPATALAASHLYSFAVNFLWRGEYRKATVGSLTFGPLPRLLVLHLSILVAGFLCIILGSPLPLLVLLVVGKTALDLVLHEYEHAKNTPAGSG